MLISINKLYIIIFFFIYIIEMNSLSKINIIRPLIPNNMKQYIIEINSNLNLIEKLIPKISYDLYKGQMGKIGILGGSPLYSGAPYYSAAATLKLGGDLAFIYTAEEAALSIKSYSPELMVLPIYNTNNFILNDMISKVVEQFNKIHTLIIGPGLGHHNDVLEATKQIILEAIDYNLPLVIDADGLFLLTKYPNLINGYQNVILTPNIIEFYRLYKSVLNKENNYNNNNNKGYSSPELDEIQELSNAMGNITIFMKGHYDIIVKGNDIIISNEIGSPRRCGGIGDILAGSIGLLNHWTSNINEQLYGINLENESITVPNSLWSAWLASNIVKKSSYNAYLKHKRSTTSPDILNEIGNVVESLSPTIEIIENDTC